MYLRSLVLQSLQISEYIQGSKYLIKSTKIGPQLKEFCFMRACTYIFCTAMDSHISVFGIKTKLISHLASVGSTQI